MSKAKIVGFITVFLILFLLVFWTFKIVNKTKEKAKEEALFITHEKNNIDMSLKGSYLEYLSVGDTYVEKGVKAITKAKKDISDEVLISYYKDNIEVAKIDTTTSNNYLVKYTSVDSKTDKITSIYKTVIIKED